MKYEKKELKRYLKKCVGHQREKHSKNTAKEAVKLAKKYGADQEKAYVAGLLHDVAKGQCRFGLRKLAKEYELTIDEFEMRNPELTHGKLGAIMVSKHLGIKDKDILSAIRWHTTGHADMTLIEKVVYIADIIEPGRKFEGVQSIRLLAYKDLDKAMILALEYVMKFVHSKGFALHPKSIEAYQYFKELEEAK
jgi:predicted HD superfamily hydrolase involved in NAD metabolism